MRSSYPVGLRLTGRRVLVVGAGRVAARRVPALLDAGAHVLLVAPQASPSLQALADAGRLVLLDRPYADGDVDGAWYVLAATDDPAVNAVVAAAAEAARVFCVRADDAAASSAWTPAVGRHDGLTVAVSAGGDPGRAAGVRDAVVRGLQDATLDAPRRRRPPGVVLVGGGPGDAGLITVRGAQALRDADVVVADHLAPWSLLDELGPDVEIVDASKLPQGRAMAQEEINALLVGRARAGHHVVRLKGGDPMVFGRGYEELLACAAAGVPCEVVPGVSSALAVPVAAGIPVTHRGLAQEVLVVSGHLPPGHPSSTVDWGSAGRLRGTLVLLMAVHNLGVISAALIAAGRPPATPTAVVCSGTTAAETVLRTTLDRVAVEVRERDLRPPAVVVVGDVVALGASGGALGASG